MIGAIADDYTGATDVAVAFRREGLRTVLVFGVPATPPVLPPHDARAGDHAAHRAQAR